MKALELADKINSLCVAEFAWPYLDAAATELRRLHAESEMRRNLAQDAMQANKRLAEVNAELVAALENMIAASLPDETYGHCTSDIENAAYFARGALAKAKEQQ